LKPDQPDSHYAASRAGRVGGQPQALGTQMAAALRASPALSSGPESKFNNEKDKYNEWNSSTT